MNFLLLLQATRKRLTEENVLFWFSTNSGLIPSFLIRGNKLKIAP